MAISAERDWKSFGDADPYFGVLANEKFRAATIDGAAVDEFFASGVTHVDKVLRIAKDLFGFEPRGVALDFGCGVGRITNALSAHFSAVTGLDISPGMLTQARADSAKRGVHNVAYANSLDPDRMRPESYDFVHTYIVLQHIPTRIGETIIRDMVAATKSGGVGAIHFTYGYANAPRLAASKNFVKKTPILREIGNLVLGRPHDHPPMQMNCYAIPRVIEILASCGVDRFAAVRIDDWGNLGLFLFFEKREATTTWSNPRI